MWKLNGIQRECYRAAEKTAFSERKLLLKINRKSWTNVLEKNRWSFGLFSVITRKSIE